MYALLLRMRDLAMILRRRRMKRGALELNMPEAELEYDEQGRVAGAHFRKDDVSHQLIEEFMLTANESVAELLAGLDVPFLRRVHPDPDPRKLEAFAGFARSLGYKMERHLDRFALQRVLEHSADKPEVYAVHYALLRSLKQAVYSPADEGHYALASDDYCHFTSPIRRYPDLTVHRQLGKYLRTGKAGADASELATLGEHCSKTERRAEAAERELVKLKLLTYLSERIGTELEVVITGVADYGFFGQAETLPVEGMVHVSTLARRLLLLRGGDAQPDRPAHRPALSGWATRCGWWWCAWICSGGSWISAWRIGARRRPRRRRSGAGSGGGSDARETGPKRERGKAVRPTARATGGSVGLTTWGAH